MQIYDKNIADSSAAARVQALCPRWFTLKMVNALCLYTPPWPQPVCINNCEETVICKQMLYSWTFHGMGGGSSKISKEFQGSIGVK